VDDEPSITELLATALRYMGYQVTVADSGFAALDAAATSAPDLVVLDVMLPDLDGFEVCRRLRAARDFVPVIFLSARDSEGDRVTGFVRGGDDYVTKPFSLEEVVARIRAVLRRTQDGQPEDDMTLQVADLELDEDSHEVRRGGTVIEVSPTEFKLLRYLMVNSGRVLSKAQILDHVWDYDFRGEMGIVESYISYLRRKIDRDGEPLIHTKRGVGYVLRAPRT
jgi:two-component system OmpR family response regulator